METKDIILELRKSLHLSQREFAEKLSVTRQAVSRWENGETLPNIDTLRFIAETFQVSADYLLGRPAGQCQSCGARLEQDSDRGTEADGTRSEDFCAFCYQQGTFTQDITMEQMVELNLQALDEWNQAEGLHLTKQEARSQLLQFLPTLKRWKPT